MSEHRWVTFAPGFPRIEQHGRAPGRRSISGMKVSLRKGNQGVYVTYRRFGETDDLVACDFTLEADEKRVLFSMDFSASERTRHKDSNLYLDVQKLIEQMNDVERFELSIEKWLNPLAAALQKRRQAVRELEIRFKNAPRKLYRYDLETDKYRLLFNIRNNGMRYESDFPRALGVE